MPRLRRRSAGFSLIELLIVLAVLGVLVGLAMPSASPGLYDQLRSAAQILRTDLAYARSLAIGNDSRYRVTFEIANNRYILEHSGTNPALDTLPDTPFRAPGDPPDKQIVEFDNLPRVGGNARLVAVATAGGTVTPVTEIEYGPLGQTTQASPTTIWLAAGQDAATRYLWIEVNPVTGLARLGNYSSSGPPAAALGGS